MVQLITALADIMKGLIWIIGKLLWITLQIIIALWHFLVELFKRLKKGPSKH